MKKASIISVGNELLSGEVVDTNAAFLSGRLLSMGIPTVSCYMAGDDAALIAATIGQAAAQALAIQRRQLLLDPLEWVVRTFLHGLGWEVC